MNRKPIIILAILILVSISCGFSAKDDASNEEAVQSQASEIVIPTVKPTKTPNPVAPVQPTSESQEQQNLSEPPSEPEEEEQVVSNAPRFFLDEFEGDLNETDWYTDLYSGSEDEDPYYEISQRRGALVYYLDSPWLYLYRFYDPHVYMDVRIDFEVENKGVNSNNIGAVCRLTDEGWYEFITTSGGYYSIMRYDVYGDEELAYGGIKSISFGADKKNIYTFICSGKHFILIVNGVEIVDVVDEEMMVEGTAGINISAEEVLPVQVQFNWLQFSQP